MSITLKNEELRKIVGERAIEILAIMPAFDFGAASLALLNINQEFGEEVISEQWAENYLFNLAAAGILDSIHNKLPIFRIPNYVATSDYFEKAVSFNMDTTRNVLNALLVRAEFGFNNPIKYGYAQIQDLVTAVLKVIVHQEKPEHVDEVVRIVAKEASLGRPSRKTNALILLRRYKASASTIMAVENA